ncbi:MAG: hypothetical protein IJC99_03290 [Clostridia bacterium]|nr:hypothetical protein [Clostridia bacterium]
MSKQDNFPSDNDFFADDASAPGAEGAPEDLFADVTAPAAEEMDGPTTGETAAESSEAAAQAAQAPQAAQAAGTGKKAFKSKVPKRCKKKRLRRPFWRVVRFLLILLLGILVGYASIAGVIYYAIAGLTIDDLQKFGIAEGADRYLTEGGEVDLTATSLLAFIQDLNRVRDDLSAHSIESLIARYGIVLPEETLAKFPPALLQLPLSSFSEGNPLMTITSNINCGYLLSYLPEGALNPHMVEAIKERPLSLLLESKYDELFAGVKLGYLTGVTFDESGAVVYANPEAPTSQESFAMLDMGNLIGAISKNGDIMAVLADDLGTQDVAPILTGFMSGALFEKMCEGNTVADVLLFNESTGRYAFSLTALTEHVYLGDALGYTLVEGAWYSTYTDDGDDTNDVAVSVMQSTLAGVMLSEVIGGTLSIDATFDGLYFGDLQNGYTKGDAVYGVDPESGEPVITGYNWLKDGVAVSKIQNKLANLAVNDMLNGGLDINATLGDLFIGDLQGYTLGNDERWYRTVEGESAPTYVGAVQNAVAGIPLSDVLDGNLDIVATLGTLSLGDVQGYTLGNDGRWYRTVEGESELIYVGAVQNAIADVKLSEVLEGTFSISEAFSELLLGDAMGYERGEVNEPADPTDPDSYDEYDFTKSDGTPVVGAMLSIANLKLSDVLDGKADFEGAIKEMPLGDVLEYTNHDGVWYETFVEEGSPENKPAKGFLSTIADLKVNEINTTEINKITLGKVLGYTPHDENEDEVFDGWLDEEGKSVTGMMRVLADLTIGDMSNDDTLLSTIRSVSLGDALGYTKIDGVWYTAYSDDGNGENDTKLSGIMKVLADNSLASINESTIDNIVLGEALGYEKRGDDWYDANGVVTGAIVDMADLTLGELRNQTAVIEKIGEMRLATVLDYKKIDGVWVSNKTHLPATGVLEYLLDTQIKEVDSHTNDMPLGHAFGYHIVDGKWSVDAFTYVAPTGVTAALADVKLCDAATELNTMPVGELLGYTKQGSTWYEKYVAAGSAQNIPLRGISLAFADLSVSELGEAEKLSAAMQTVTLGDAMGYTKGADGWYHAGVKVTGVLGALADSKISALEGEIKSLSIGTLLGMTKGTDGVWRDSAKVPATGVLAAIADCKAENLENTLNTMEIGTLLGFQKSGTVWLDGTNTPVKGMLATISATTVEDLPEKMKTLTVADVFAEDERTGVLKVVPASTEITKLGDAVLDCKISALMSAGVIKPVTDGQNAIITGLVGSGWTELSLIEFMNFLLTGSLN